MNNKIMFVALAFTASAFLFYLWLPESDLPKENESAEAGDVRGTSVSNVENPASPTASNFDGLSDDAKIQFLDDQKARGHAPLLADLAMRALESPSLEVRAAAIAAVTHLQSNELLPVLRKALSDTSAELRRRALHEAREKAPVLRLNLLETALSSTFPDTRDGALIELTRENPKAAVPIMMEGLNSPDADFRQRVWQEIYPNVQALRKEPFANTTEALDWWAKVNGQFDSSMVLLNPSVAPSEN
jgi:hypothetical protein